MAAAALDAAAAKAALGVQDEDTWEAELPEALSEVAAKLQSGEIRWCSGLRIGDPVEIGAPHKHLPLLLMLFWTVSIELLLLLLSGGLGPQWHLLPGEIQQEKKAQSDTPVATGGTFRFIELFAGIGGTRTRACVALVSYPTHLRVEN